jgi:hypothetical protein
MRAASKNVKSALKWAFGPLLCATLAAVAYAAYRFGNQEFLYLALGFLCFLALSAILSVIAVLSIRTAAPVAFDCIPQSGGASYRGGVVSPSWAQSIARLNVRWISGDRVLPAEIELKDGRENLCFASRMMEGNIIREVTVSDWSGIFRWRRSGQLDSPIRVDPPLRNARLAKDFYNGTDGDLESLSGKACGDVTDSRYYQSGDSVRRILWGVVAKQGGLARAGEHLLVRTEERVTSRRVAIFFLPGGDDDESAAGFARTCLEKDVLGNDWVFTTTGSRTPLKRDVRKAIEAIDSTGGERELPMDVSLAEFGSFARQVGTSGIGNLFVIATSSVLEDRAVVAKLVSTAPHAAILAISRGERPESPIKPIRTVIVEPA